VRDDLDLDRDHELDLTGEEPPADEAPAGKPAAGKAKSKSTSSGTTKGSGGRTPSETDLKRRIDEGLDELVSVVRDFVGSDSVATAIEDDKKRMAEVLAAHAMKRAGVARWVVRLFGKDSALAGARAFGPTFRHVVGAVRDGRDERRARRAETDTLDTYYDEETGEHRVGPRPSS
jgi:hypothetical protein